MSDTIIALATAPFKSALALIRMSGKDSFEYAKKVFSKPQKIKDSRTTIFGELLKDGEAIDQVVLFLYPSSSSMTGENVVEISCHGSMVIVNQIIDLFLSLGARYAERGEFTERAFLSGKMDLIQCEAVNELVNSTTDEGKKLALLSLKGEASSLVGPIKKSIGDILSLIEVNIDYPEYEDIEVVTTAKIIDECEEIRKTIQTLVKQGNEGRIIKEGVKVAIVGEPNVGKSSLLNALLGEDKAIVSPIPGTTRDLVEGSFSVNGVPFILLDTAGIRKTDDVIEKIGVERSEKTIEASDIVLLVMDVTNPALPKGIEKKLEGKKVIYVWNKKDLSKTKADMPIDGVFVSAKNEDIAELKEKMVEVVGLSQTSFESASLSNARQIGILKQIDLLLERAETEAKDGVPLDLISVSLHKALNETKELLGENVSQDISDEIFSRFCIGK